MLACCWRLVGVTAGGGGGGCILFHHPNNERVPRSRPCHKAMVLLVAVADSEVLCRYGLRSNAVEQRYR